MKKIVNISFLIIIFAIASTMDAKRVESTPHKTELKNVMEESKILLTPAVNIEEKKEIAQELLQDLETLGTN